MPSAREFEFEPCALGFFGGGGGEGLRAHGVRHPKTFAGPSQQSTQKQPAQTKVPKDFREKGSSLRGKDRLRTPIDRWGQAAPIKGWPPGATASSNLRELGVRLVGREEQGNLRASKKNLASLL